MDRLTCESVGRIESEFFRYVTGSSSESEKQNEARNIARGDEELLWTVKRLFFFFFFLQTDAILFTLSGDLYPSGVDKPACVG